MKKIIGIIAAVAMAASVFAADFNVTSKLSGNLFDFEQVKILDDTVAPQAVASKSTVKMFTYDGQGKTASYANMIGLSAGGDNFGGQLKIWAAGGSTLTAGDYYIWIKPIEMLKIQLGEWSYGLFGDSITYVLSDGGKSGTGWSFALTPVDGLSIDLGLSSTWMETKKSGKANALKNPATADGDPLKGFAADKEKAVIGTTAVKVGYSADFGSIGVIFAASPAEIKDDDDSVSFNKNFGDIKFGAGYSNTFSGITAKANVIAYMNYNNRDLNVTTFKLEGDATKGYTDTMGIDAAQQKFEKVRLEVGANGSADALSWEVFVPVDIYVNKYATGAWSSKYQDLNEGADIAAYQWLIDNIYPAEYKAAGQTYLDSYAKRIPVGITFNGKVGYNLGNGMNVGLQVTTGNLLATDLKFDIVPSISGSVGAVSWGVKLEAGITTCGHKAHESKNAVNGMTVTVVESDELVEPHNKFTLKVPVEFTISF